MGQIYCGNFIRTIYVRFNLRIYIFRFGRFSKLFEIEVILRKRIVANFLKEPANLTHVNCSKYQKLSIPKSN